jgi:LysR family transcriptional regulator, cell division regulator
MNFTDFRVVEAVARLGSMNQAAAELHTVQSNITGRVRALELELGVVLFDRHRRGVAPTAACKRLLPYATKIGHMVKEAEAAVRDNGMPQGQLQIGSLETTAALRLPPILTAYTQRYPDVDLVMRTGTSASLVTDVVEHRLDGAFVAGPIQHVDLDEEPVMREELVVVTPPAMRSLMDVDGMRRLRTIVFRVGCAYRQRLDAILAARGLQATQPLEFGSLEAILGCVAAGIGITLLPKVVVADAWRRGIVAVHELPTAQASVETMFVRRRDVFVSSALKALMEIARPTQVGTAIAAE